MSWRTISQILYSRLRQCRGRRNSEGLFHLQHSCGPLAQLLPLGDFLWATGRYMRPFAQHVVRLSKRSGTARCLLSINQ